MLKIDNNLLDEIGLGDLPAEEKNRMLAHIYETLEMRVGVALAKQMSDTQLKEFEGFIDGDEDNARAYLDARFAGWEQSEGYTKQAEAQSKGGIPPSAIISEYAALKWLETNFPDYKKVVAAELDKLKEEIKTQSQNIVAQTDQPGPPQQPDQPQQ